MSGAEVYIGKSCLDSRRRKQVTLPYSVLSRLSGNADTEDPATLKLVHAKLTQFVGQAGDIPMLCLLIGLREATPAQAVAIL